MPFIKSGDQPRVTLVVPGVIALAIMSTAFTAQAISVGFDRRYGVLKLLGVTPLSRIRLLLAKTVAILVIEAIQIVLILAVAAILGWRPVGNPAGALGLVILGTAAFSALSFALAGVLRAEATLAAANAIYLILLLAGGTVIPAIRCRVGWARRAKPCRQVLLEMGCARSWQAEAEFRSVLR